MADFKQLAARELPQFDAYLKNELAKIQEPTAAKSDDVLGHDRW
ncbi:hypothetical protein QY895_03365 [Latilactobacillus sakei]